MESGGRGATATGKVAAPGWEKTMKLSEKQLRAIGDIKKMIDIAEIKRQDGWRTVHVWLLVASQKLQTIANEIAEDHWSDE